jgi:hypothetical protein
MEPVIPEIVITKPEREVFYYCFYKFDDDLPDSVIPYCERCFEAEKHKYRYVTEIAKKETNGEVSCYTCGCSEKKSCDCDFRCYCHFYEQYK